MAFQAPVVNVASITNDIWPQMRSTLSAPWRMSQQQNMPSAPSRHRILAVARRPVSTQSVSKVDSAISSSVELPDCLTAVQIASLKPINQLRSLAPGRASTFNSIPSIPILQAANPFHYRTPSTTQPIRFHSTFSLFRSFGDSNPVKSRLSNDIQRRLIFGGSSSQNLLAHMEQTANNNPTSATAQNAFYSALLRADMPAVIVERYQTGRFATSSACETTYHRALDKLARVEGISGLKAGTQTQLQNNSSPEQSQAIAQGIAAYLKGTNTANVKAGTTGSGGKADPIHVTVNEPLSTTIFQWFRFFAMFAFVAWIITVLINFAVEASGALKKVTGMQSNEAQPQQQNVRFTDVHGCEEAKEELQELVEFLKNPEKFSTLGGKLPKGVLLVGPPGTGKTLLARAVAGEAGVPFFYMSGSEFEEIYVGVGAKRVRELFANARSKAPAIVFIDELDAIGGKRNDKDMSYSKQSLNQLLTELDGFSQDTGVIILAATNLPQLLDKALTRPGRFDRNVVVPLPDVRGRLAILKHHTRNMILAGDVDNEILARGTTGFSGAELENMVNQAAVRASRNKATKIGMLDFEWAKDKIVMGAERRSAVIQDKDKLMTAYHEAGHALVGIYTKGATPLYKATIMPRGQALGITHFMAEMDKVSRNKQEYTAEIDVCMGGKVAEQLVYGEENVTSGASADIASATKTAYYMITQCGMSSTLGNMDLATDYSLLSTETKMQIEHEVRRLIDEGHQRAKDLLTERRKELDVLAKALVEYEVLSFDEIKRVLNGEKLNKLKSVPNSKPGFQLPEIVLPPGMGSGSGRPGNAAVAVGEIGDGARGRDTEEGRI